MTKQEYLKKIAQIIEYIRAGDLYQANLTRKFIGHFSAVPDGLALFNSLCTASPAPYSAYINLGDVQILSSSPEKFLSLDKSGLISVRPIKGTAARFDDEEQDAKSRERLAESPKDQAENLMIADLMRNDLARNAVAGSVKAEKLFEVTSHATIHHMSSTIHAQKIASRSALDVVAGCFPPGSMTGAPKISAINLCSALEPHARGIYSGAIGWFGGDGSCELSVVIRTILLKNDRFEFQVGGGIIADSDPEKEWEETLDKTQGILLALGITREYIENI